jgi:hypothetical protein
MLRNNGRRQKNEGRMMNACPVYRGATALGGKIFAAMLSLTIKSLPAFATPLVCRWYR